MARQPKRRALLVSPLPPGHDDFTGRKVLILGVGVLGGGIGMAKYCAEHGADLRITDLRNADQLRPALKALEGIKAEYIWGRHRDEDIDWADIVVRNPGVPPHHRLLERARAQGKPVEMEIPYFIRNCPARLIAVTGTKGKTTTTMVLHRFLEASGRKVAVAGNMGESAMPLLDVLGPDDEVLLEVSSYQLEGLADRGGPVSIAVITNVEDDHLDRYGTLERYREVKAAIGRGQSDADWLVLPASDRALAELCEGYRSRKVYVHEVDAPAGSHDWTAGAANVDIHDQAVVWHAPDGRRTPIADMQGLKLLGAHNRVNVAFAAAAAHIAGRSSGQITGAMRSIVPVAHRLEPIGRAGHIEFINDSAASAPLAVVAALDALAGRRPVVITGGDDKAADYAMMITALADAEAPVVLLPGTATGRLRADMAAMGYKYPVLGALTMAEAVDRAFDLASCEPGAEVVLLSPGFSSHSVFINEFDRGNQFREGAERIIGRAAG
jgi:UDP-N-acetylmuramoylalanine--D-glutamate ligase